jgi:hypothetical protein
VAQGLYQVQGIVAKDYEIFESDRLQEEYLSEETPSESDCDRHGVRSRIGSKLLPVQVTNEGSSANHSTDMTAQEVAIDVLELPHNPCIDKTISKLKQNSELQRLACQSWAAGFICPHEGCQSWNPDIWPRKGADICCACSQEVGQWVDATSLRESERNLIVHEELSRGAEEVIGGMGILGSGYMIGVFSVLFVLKVVIQDRMTR